MIIISSSQSPSLVNPVSIFYLLNYDKDPAYAKLKSGIDARTELLKQQYKLYSKHRMDNPEKEFIGIDENTVEPIQFIIKKYFSTYLPLINALLNGL